MYKQTKFFMTCAALINGVIGIIVSFFPYETAHIFKIYLSNSFQSLPFKILGASIFGFAVLNYMKRDSRLGGIYEKPTVMSNAIFHSIVGVQSLKILSVKPPLILIIITSIYIILAGGFIYMYFNNPVERKFED